MSRHTLTKRAPDAKPPVAVRLESDDGAARARRTRDPDVAARRYLFPPARAPHALARRRRESPSGRRLELREGRNGQGEAGEAAGLDEKPADRSSWSGPRATTAPPGRAERGIGRDPRGSADPAGTRAHAVPATTGSTRASGRDGHGEAGEGAGAPGSSRANAGCGPDREPRRRRADAQSAGSGASAGLLGSAA
jgi:hypothetical protein